MISKKATTLLANIYVSEFSGKHNNGKLYDFLYDRNYDGLFLQYSNHNSEQNIKILIQDLQDTSLYGKSGQELLTRLSQDILQFFETVSSNRFADFLNKDLYRHQADLVDSFLNQLESDGYFYKNGRVLPIENTVINQQTEQNYLEVLIDSLSLSNSKVIKHHLNLSEEHYSNGNWGDCISNSRMALESILQQVAEAIHIKKNGVNLAQNIYTRPVEVRKYLEAENFFDTKETKTISEVYGLLSNTGSHPNMSEKDQARLMRNLALSLSQYALITYEGFLKNNP